MNKTINKNNLYAGLISLGIISLLVLAGPANAFNINLLSDKQSVVQGEDVSFNLKLDLTPYNENNVKNIKLSLDGPLTRNCLFDVNGSMISACLGIKSITRLLTNSTYGYSYGYGYGSNNLEYLIVLGTNDLPTGDYDVSAKVILKNNNEADSNSESLKVNGKENNSENNKNSSGKKKKRVNEENTGFNPISNDDSVNTENNDLDLSNLDDNKDNEKNNQTNENNIQNNIINFIKNILKNILSKIYSLF
ncbi:MAG: hypothetical protein QXI33_02230 [Candidatus Pacearchaeota archaeon]